jgi:hypothetical protein
MIPSGLFGMQTILKVLDNQKPKGIITRMAKLD